MGPKGSRDGRMAGSDVCTYGDRIALLPVRVHTQSLAACYERASSAVAKQIRTWPIINTE